MSNGLKVQLGTIDAGATPIIVDIGGGLAALPVSVTILVPYTRTAQPGYPMETPGGQEDAANFGETVVFAEGDVLTVLVPEANALISAGAAELTA